MNARVEDILYVMNHFEELQSRLTSKSIDFSTFGIVGHSLGGAAAFEVAAMDTRIQAGVMFDASFHLLYLNENVKVNTPFLIMRQDKCTYEELRNELSEGIINPFINGYEKLYHVFSGYKSCVKIHGAHHMTFSDVPLHYKEEHISENHKLISKYATRFLCEFTQIKKQSYQRLLSNKESSEIVEIDMNGYPIH